MVREITDMHNLRESAYRVVRNVAAPLHFFAVVAIVLGAIIVSFTLSDLPPEIRLLLIERTYFVLIFVVIVVGILIVFFPKKLVFDKEAHLAVMREKLGDSEFPIPYEAGTHPLVNESKIQIEGRKKP